jgi:hypothetical protein
MRYLAYFAVVLMLLAIGAPTWIAYEREHSAPPVHIDGGVQERAPK